MFSEGNFFSPLNVTFFWHDKIPFLPQFASLFSSFLIYFFSALTYNLLAPFFLTGRMVSFIQMHWVYLYIYISVYIYIYIWVYIYISVEMPDFISFVVHKYIWGYVDGLCFKRLIALQSNTEMGFFVIINITEFQCDAQIW